MATNVGSELTPRGVAFLGHIVVGVAALVYTAILVVAGRAPNAELGGALLGLGLLLALAGLAFTASAVVGALRARQGRGGALAVGLSAVELVVGGAMVVGLVRAVQGYRAFEPWRSPLLLPSLVLVGLGLWGVVAEVAAHRTLR